MFESFFAIIAIAIVIEGIVEYAKMFYSSANEVKISIVLSVVLSVIASIGFGLDIFAILGIASTIPYLGTVLTGIVIARGSNYIYDLIGKITKIEKE